VAYGVLSSRAIVGRFYQRYEQALQSGWAKKVGWENTSNQESETYAWLGQAPVMREWLGGRLSKQLNTNQYTIRNKLFEATMNVNVDDKRRDKTGQIMIRTGDLAARTAEHWEKLLTDLIIANGLCYDGQNFFDTDHVTLSSGTLQNDLDATDIPALNVSTAAAPTATEAAKIIVGAVEYFFGYKDEQGEPINGGARRFAIMVPTNMFGSFAQATTAERLDSGNSNPALSFQAGSGLTVEVVVNPRLTTTTELYAFRIDSEVKPFILQTEQDVKLDVVAEGSEEEFKNRQHLYGVTALRNVGYGLWQYAMRLTTS